MKKFVKVLITIVIMALVMVAGVGIYKLVLFEKDKAFEEERVVRVEELTPVTEEIKEEISEISKLGHDEIQSYIDDNAFVDDSEERAFNDEEMLEIDPWGNGDWESNGSAENVNRVAELGLEAVKSMQESVSENSLPEESAADGSVSGNSISEDSVSGNSVSGNSVSGNSVSGNSVSGNSVSGNSVSDNSVSGNSVSGNSAEAPKEKKITLKDRQTLRSSYEETHLWMEADNEVLENSDISFKGKKIACLGDSITEAANLLEEPDYEKYPYPKRLSELLDADVQNLGIGGSSYGRYWYEPFCERYQQIDEDTDIIIVMGGTNDGYCLHEDMIGSFEECEPKTLYGDIDELFAGLKENYPNAEIFVATPMPNLLHDVLRKERPELLPETVVVNAVLEEAEKHDLKVIDLYNSNFFDSHDADVVSEFIPDSVHPNPDGYEVLAKHLAAEMIRMMDEETAAPVETPTPEETATPEETPTPEETATPQETPLAEETAVPEETTTPEETATPKETPASIEDEKPSQTPKNTIISRDS